jgi:Sec-independent protein translocase protein TatA
MFGMGHWEILAILLVVLLLFGSKRIPSCSITQPMHQAASR